MADQSFSNSARLRVPARGFLHGSVGVEQIRGGFVRPLRITPAQLRVLGSVSALHPGQFRGMAACTAGITLEFDTDASTVAIELRHIPQPQGTRFVHGEMAKADPKSVSMIEDFTVEMDGAAHPYLQYFDSSLYIDIAGHSGRLPGFGDRHRFRVWLPVMTGVELGNISCDGSFIDPVPARRTLLVLGDSIAQGYAAATPAAAWTARIAKLLDADVVNQGIGAHVFQPFTVPRLEQEPFAVVIAYGENYRYEKLPLSRIESDIRAYLDEVAHVFEGVPVFVVSPLWHNEQASPSADPECLAFVRLLLEELSVERGFTFIDGAKLIDADPALFADGYEHPGDAGMAQIARRLALIMDDVLGDEQARRERALELLKDAPMTAFPLAEQIRRGVGRVVVAEKNVIFLKIDERNQFLYALERDAGRNVLASCVEPTELCMLGRVALRDAQYILGMHRLTPCYLAVYEKSVPPALDATLDIRVLDRSFADAIMANYTRSYEHSKEELEELLDAGTFLGCFDGGELAGFIGEHPEGAFGMLEVLPGSRRRGWATALLSAKVAQHMARGYVPWSEVFPDNAASLKLHEQVGFSFYPAEGMTFMNTPAYD